MSLPPLPALLVIGVSHQYAPLEVRERLAFGPERLPVALRRLETLIGGRESGAEAALLSTCNRTEVYLASPQPECANLLVREFLSEYAGLPLVRLNGLLYAYTDQEAIHHLLHVAAGLDSIVLGENEILGQVRRAGDVALEVSSAGPLLAALFRSAVQAGKRVRSETEITQIAGSLGLLVADLARDTFGSLQEHTALLIGAGKISMITAQALVKAGLNCVLVANRTFNRAQRMVENLGGFPRARAIHFDALETNLCQADILISSTGAPHIVLHTETIERAMKARPSKPLLIADLAVPRDVDPAVGCLPEVQLIDIDGLECQVASRYPLTEAVRREALEIIEAEAEAFQSWYVARRSAPVIRSLRQKADEICEEQIAATLRRLGSLSPDQVQAIRSMSSAIANRLLHDPLRSLKKPPEGKTVEEWADLVAALYSLEPQGMNQDGSAIRQGEGEEDTWKGKLPNRAV